MFISLNDAIAWIESKKRSRKRENLDNYREALKELGNPHESFKCIHIGGTNGKGSTSVYLSSIMKEKYEKVGLYISPYVLSFNERIQLNNTPISKSDLLVYINFIKSFSDKFEETHDTLSFFDLITLIAFLYFKDMKVDIAIIEVGLGGRLDSTNVINPLTSIITYISRDHSKELGNTNAKRAMEKLGIVKEGIPLLTFEHKPRILSIFSEFCRKKNSDFIPIKNLSKPKIIENGMEFKYRGKYWKIPLLGDYQVLNASLVIETINLLNTRYDLGITDEMIENGLLKTKMPCRFEVFNKDGVIIDGAHNPNAIRNLFRFLKKYTKKDIIVIYGAMKDKDYDLILRIISRFTSNIIFTRVDYPRAESENHLYQICNIENKWAFSDINKAIKFAKKIRKDRLIIVTGSLYLASDARKVLVGDVC